MHTFKPSNVLTFETVDLNSQALFKLLNHSKEMSEICLDLSQVKNCDSTGLAMLIEAKRRCKKKNIHFSIENIPDSIWSLAEFCGVDAVLE